MIQINLIPDVKRELLRAQRLRNTAIAVSMLAGVAAVGVVVLLGAILGIQQVRQAFIEQSIKDEYKKLSSVEDIDNVLTIQNQLGNISMIAEDKSKTSRLLTTLLAINPPAPNDIKMSAVKLDPSQSMITIDGSAANAFSATDMLRKTILNTKVEATGADDAKTVQPLTDAVEIGETSYGEDSTGAKVLRFTLSFRYLDGLFSDTLKNVNVITPTSQIDVTDSSVRVPDSLFSQKATDTEGDN